MSTNASSLQRLPFYLSFGAAVSILFSIAVSHNLMGLAFLALLILARDQIRFPPIKLPLGLFFLGTILSWLLSPDLRHGIPQIKKFFVFLIALLVYSTYRELAQIRATVLVWGGIASISALISFVQFVRIYEKSAAAHKSFYEFYVGSRITGFMSHWMTFGGEEMIVLLVLAAFLFFAPPGRWTTPGWAAIVLLAMSMALGMTRSIWLGTLAAGLYLIWFWKRWLILAVPVLVGAMLLFGPVRERAMSLFHSHGDLDSNDFRKVVWRTGLEMIKAHPWFGLGPEQIAVKAQFEHYIPPDIPRPLPTGFYGHLHNIYIQYAAERGIPTMLMMMWVLGRILYDSARALLRGTTPGRKWILHGAIAVVIGILVEGVAENNLGDSEVLTLFLICTSFAYLAIDHVTAES